MKLHGRSIGLFQECLQNDCVDVKVPKANKL